MKARSEFKEVHRLRHYTPNDMFTKDEILAIINECNNPRDKALVAMLYDGAFRPHELIILRIGDVAFHDKYAQVTVPEETKTGTRTLPIIFSFPYIRDWLNCHPLKHQPGAYIFVRNKGLFRNESATKHAKPYMTYENLYMLFYMMRKRLNHKLMKRYWYPYMLRHSRLTELATLYTDQQLKTFAGWTPDSPMPSTYVHLSGKDLDQPLLIQHGIIPRSQQKPELSINECPRCKHPNQLTNKFCDKCSLAISVEAFEEMKQKEKELENKYTTQAKEIEELKAGMEHTQKAVEMFMKLQPVKKAHQDLVSVLTTEKGERFLVAPNGSVTRIISVKEEEDLDKQENPCPYCKYPTCVIGNGNFSDHFRRYHPNQKL